jgi:hypothetical protein
MSTHKTIEEIQLYTQDARQRAKDSYWSECRASLVKAIELIDSL